MQRLDQAREKKEGKDEEKGVIHGGAVPIIAFVNAGHGRQEHYTEHHGHQP